MNYWPRKGLWEPPIYSPSGRSTGGLGLSCNWHLNWGWSCSTERSQLWDLMLTPGRYYQNWTDLFDTHLVSESWRTGIRKDTCIGFRRKKKTSYLVSDVVWVKKTDEVSKVFQFLVLCLFTPKMIKEDYKFQRTHCFPFTCFHKLNIFLFIESKAHHHHSISFCYGGSITK